MLTIGEVAERSGHATSAIRFYEAERLSIAHAGARRTSTCLRHVLRRLAFIRAAQRVGLTLDGSRRSRGLPTGPRADQGPAGRRCSAATGARRLDKRIAELEELRDDLTSCIGVRCLSLRFMPTVEPRSTTPAAAAPAPGTWLGDDPCRGQIVQAAARARACGGPASGDPSLARLICQGTPRPQTSLNSPSTVSSPSGAAPSAGSALGRRASPVAGADAVAGPVVRAGAAEAAW